MVLFFKVSFYKRDKPSDPQCALILVAPFTYLADDMPPERGEHSVMMTAVISRR